MTSIMATPADLAKVDKLRKRLARREEVLALLRKRIDAARSGLIQHGKPLSSVGDISKRFMHAAAEAEARVEETRSFTGITHSNGGVASLLSKWNKGFEEKKIEKERVSVRGDIRSVKNKFDKPDTSLAKDNAREAAKSRQKNPADRYSSNGRGRYEEVVEDEDVPAWAINQSKRVVKRESARGATQGVDLRNTATTFLNQGDTDIDTSGVRETFIPKGNVSNVLAMWNQKSEEQEAREREAALREETMRKLRESMQARTSLVVPQKPEPAEEETYLPVDDEEEEEEEPEPEIEVDEEEPTDIRDLIEYLERKCAKVERDIESAEEELSKIDQLSQ